MVAYARSVSRHGLPCWTCCLPPDLLTAIHEARSKGATIPGIVSYLVNKKGYPAKEAARVKNHFTSKHEQR